MGTPDERLRSAEQALWRCVGARPTERYLDLDMPRLRVRVQEIGAGPPALFVHGAMTGGSSFATLAAKLPGLRCILLDRPGCVLSDPLPLSGPDFRTEAVQVLSSVLDALGLHRAILVGNSLGALWSTWLALAQPSRVTRLMLLGPSVGFPGVRPPIFMRLLAAPGLGDFMISRMRPTRESLRGVFEEMGHASSLANGRIPNEMFEWGVRVQAETPTAKNELQNIRRAVGFFGVRAWTKLSDDALRSIVPPTLIVSGETDTHGGPALARRVAALVPHAMLQMVPSGHLPWLDDPAFVAETMLRVAAST